MKTNIFKSLLVLMLFFMALPMMGQDFMNVYFKDGSERKFYLCNVKEIISSRFDESGVQHSDYEFQHVTTQSGTIVYRLADVDSITFTKFYEEQTKQDFHAAMSTAMPALADCETIDDAEQKVEQIKHSEGVDDAWSDGHELYIKIKNWETISFHFSHDEDAETENAISVVSQIKAMMPQLKRKVSVNGEKLSVVIANQQHYDGSRSSYIKNYFKPLLEEFAECGYDTCYIASPSLEFFRSEMYQYDIVFLITHGNYGNGVHSFVTGENIGRKMVPIFFNTDAPSKETTDEWVANMKALLENTVYDNGTVGWSYVTERRTVPYWVAYLKLYENFFGAKENGGLSEGTFRPNSLFFNVACRSMMGDSQHPEGWHSLADKLIDNHGLTMYYGYSESNYRGQKAGYHLLNSLLQGKSTQRAYSELEAKYKLESDEPECAELVWWPQNKLLFVTPTNTNPIDQTKANQDFNSIHSVEVEGFTTTADIRSISFGFEYGTDEYFNSKETVAATEEMQLTSSIDKGNVLFKGKLTGLEPGNTYWFRAFTYDGMHHNYGNICSLTIEEQQQDTRDLLLAETIGGVKYAIYKEILNENDYHENPDGWRCYRSKLTLDITKNGNTDTYVLDNNLYLDKEVPEAGQTPCMLLDFNRNKMCVFINSKDDGPYYSMDGNFYMSSINNVSFKKEFVFEGANWGWYPYFRNYNDDRVYLCNFSFAGYFTILAVRDTDGTWTLYYDNEDISPSDALAEWKRADQILVIGNP